MTFFWKHRVYILMGFKSHIFFKKTGSRPGSSGFGRAVATASFLLNPDRSNNRVDRVPGHLSGQAGFNNSAPEYTSLSSIKKAELEHLQLQQYNVLCASTSSIVMFYVSLCC
jgi:hypothetical protein